VTAPIDVHLMVIPVDRIVPDFAEAGATNISFHPEASEHIDRTIQLIKSCGCSAGLVFNPATSLNYLDYVMDKIDLILLMSVNPGFGGPIMKDRVWFFGAYNRITDNQTISPPRGPVAGQEFPLDSRSDLWSAKLTLSLATGATLVGTVFAESDAPYYVAPAHLIKGGLARSPLGTAPVGTGPYRAVRWRRGDRLELAANAFYWGGAPSIASVTSSGCPASFA